jgi:hypothetical protein
VGYRTSLSSDNAGGQSKTTTDIAQLVLTFEERHQALMKFKKLLLKLPHPVRSGVSCETGILTLSLRYYIVLPQSKVGPGLG